MEFFAYPSPAAEETEAKACANPNDGDSADKNNEEKEYTATTTSDYNMYNMFAGPGDMMYAAAAAAAYQAAEQDWHYCNHHLHHYPGSATAPGAGSCTTSLTGAMYHGYDASHYEAAYNLSSYNNAVACSAYPSGPAATNIPHHAFYHGAAATSAIALGIPVLPAGCSKTNSTRTSSLSNNDSDPSGFTSPASTTPVGQLVVSAEVEQQQISAPAPFRLTGTTTTTSSVRAVVTPPPGLSLPVTPCATTNGANGNVMSSAKTNVKTADQQFLGCPASTTGAAGVKERATAAVAENSTYTATYSSQGPPASSAGTSYHEKTPAAPTNRTAKGNGKAGHHHHHHQSKYVSSANNKYSTYNKQGFYQNTSYNGTRAQYNNFNYHGWVAPNRGSVAEAKRANAELAKETLKDLKLKNSDDVVSSDTKALEEKALQFMAMKKQENQIKANANRMAKKKKEMEGQDCTECPVVEKESHCINPVCRGLLPYHCSGIWSIFCRNCISSFVSNEVREKKIQNEEHLVNIESGFFEDWGKVYGELQGKLFHLKDAEQRQIPDISDSRAKGFDGRIVEAFRVAYPHLFGGQKRVGDSTPIKHYMGCVTECDAYTITVATTAVTNERYEKLGSKAASASGESVELPSVVAVKLPSCQVKKGEGICLDLIPNPMKDDVIACTLKIQHARTVRA
ncbi:unnamed protein product [Amoebophrya sp. A120]|nr:unnamed protein product [Amoebophrya sp. A120]|eukprot:GSA120T00005001001.1